MRPKFFREKLGLKKLSFQQKEFLKVLLVFKTSFKGKSYFKNLLLPQMGDELQRDIQDPTSAFQMLLKYSPSALEHLFDR